MKKIILTILLGFSSLAFVINKNTELDHNIKKTIASPSVNNHDSSFLIGALSDAEDNNFERLDVLKFNIWHNYNGRDTIKHIPIGWVNNYAPNDSLLTDISVYGPQVKTQLARISSHNMKAIMMRPKIDWLLYGERSDYQCDSIPSTDDLWFYSFQSPNHVGVDTNDAWQGQTQRVRYCKRNIQTTDGGAGWAVSRLRANTEQCYSYAGWQIDSTVTWLVKPRIRIDSTVAHNNQLTPVCRIKVVGQDGNTILKEVVIKAGNFLKEINGQFFYNGQYLEEFYNLSSADSLRIQGNWGDRGLWYDHARGNKTDTSEDNKIDIKVYWYGNCDMWIDYVRVDNEVAHDLLTTDATNLTHQRYEQWLEWEAGVACHNDAALKFYMELFEFANIPCMAYVSRKLDSLCAKDITLTALMSPLYMQMVPWENRFTVMNTGHVIRNYVEKMGLTDILIANYPFYTNKQPIPYVDTTFAKIPTTLPSTTGGEVFANAISPAAYDTWLQDNLDHSPAYFEEGSTSDFPWVKETAFQWEGAFRWSMKMGDAISKAEDIPFLYNGQAHLWYNNNGESHKEPTIQEMEMIANVSLTYGARGLLYFYYGEFNDTITGKFGRGFVNPGNQPRIFNAYQQPKWDMIKSQVQRMK